MSELSARQRESVKRIAALTLLNAMVFQEVISAREPEVRSLRNCLTDADLVGELSQHWGHIITHINYVPMFKVARDLLLAMPSSADVDAAMRQLASCALEIVGKRAALRHDLMGRVYHLLLVDAKHLGTYYTSVPAATMLLKICSSLMQDVIDWSSPQAISDYVVADLACGTGTLLMAVSEVAIDLHVKACVAKGVRPEIHIIQKALLETVLHGFDVLPSALHLTASTLALRSGDVRFRGTKLFSMPLGGETFKLGSIEFLRGRDAYMQHNLFGDAEAFQGVTEKGDAILTSATLPDLDLCVINPPYVRSVGGNLLFGSMPEAQRKPMQKELANLLRSQRIMASSTAGLGSVFVAIADRALKQDGFLALVLPKALLSGVAWERSRELIGDHFQIEFIMVSHDPERWSFSDNTSLSEVLLIARKRTTGSNTNHRVCCLNLIYNPRTAIEALAVAAEVIAGDVPQIEHGLGVKEVSFGSHKCGEVLSILQSDLAARTWLLPCAFAQTALVRAAYKLAQGQLVLPGMEAPLALGFVPLKDLATFGPDRRDIYDAFDRTQSNTRFAAFWGHEATDASTLTVKPNQYLQPLQRALPGRPLRNAELLWSRAGRLLLAEKVRLNTMSSIAHYSDEDVLSNVWWSVKLDDDAAKIMALYLNSTLGLMSYLMNREDTEGSWLGIRKPLIAELPVPDIRTLSSVARERLLASFEALRDTSLAPFPEMDTDAGRIAIDDALSTALALPPLTELRFMLAREPIVRNAP